MNKLVEIGKELYEKQQSLDKEVADLFKAAEPYLEVRRKHYYRRGPVEIERKFIAEDGLCYTFEYNEACHCHPEYWTEDVTVYWDSLLLTPEEYDNLLFLAKKNEKELKEKQKREESKKRKQEAEAGEKKLFEELKKKYEV